MSRRSVLISAIVGILLVPVLIAMPFLLARWSHDRALVGLRADVLGVELPAGTTVDSYDGGDTAFGNFDPTGTGCNMRVRLTVYSSATGQNLEQHFQSRLSRRLVSVYERTPGPLSPIDPAGGRSYIIEVDDQREAGLDLRCW